MLPTEQHVDEFLNWVPNVMFGSNRKFLLLKRQLNTSPMLLRDNNLTARALRNQLGVLMSHFTQ